MKKVFIFGTGRCGTVSFNKLFQSMSNTFSMHEGIFSRNGKEVRIGDMKEIPNLIYYHDHSKRYFNEARNVSGHTFVNMKKSFATRDKLIKECEDKYKVYCDVNPYAHPMIEFIYKKHPDAYFIHLIRDGYDVVNSYHLRDKTTYPPGIEEKNYRGYQSGKPRPLIGDLHYNKWAGYDRVQKVSWFWQEVNTQIVKNMSDIPESQKIIFKLEDLTVENFQNLLSKMEIKESFDSRLITKKYNSSNTKLVWTKENLIKFNKIAASAMRQFKYEVRYK